MNLILIHGALGSSDEMKPLLPYISKSYTVYCYEIPGHGTRKDELNRFSMRDIIEDFNQYTATIGEVYVFGFSLGGYLAMAASLYGNTTIKGVVTLGTKVKWSEKEALKEVQNLNLEFLKTNATPFYTYLQNLHGDHLEKLCEQTGVFMLELGANPILTPETVSSINIPVRMGRGGKDRMVDEESTCTLVNNLPHAFYTEIPNFPHPMGFLKPTLVARFLEVQLKSMHYHWADLPKSRLAYSILGTITDEVSPVCLFLHEGLGSIAQWGDFPAKLTSRLGLPGIVYEREGYGFSSPSSLPRTERYLHEFAWVELPQFIETIELKNPLILIGHSDGGSIALMYASKNSDRVVALVTMAAHLYNEEITVAGIIDAKKAWDEGKLKGLEVYHGAKTSKLFFDWNDTWQTEAFLKWNISNDSARNVDFASLIIQGEDDQYGSSNQVLDIVQLLGEQSEGLMIEQAGHSPFIDQEEIVVDEIVAFLNENELLD